MKNLTINLFVFVIAVLIVIIASQNWPANAKSTSESLPVSHTVVILRCERKPPTSSIPAGNIKITASDQSILLGNGGLIPSLEIGKPCAYAVADMLTTGYTIQSAITDSSGAFN